MVSFIVLAPAGKAGGVGCVLFDVFPLPEVVIERRSGVVCVNLINLEWTVTALFIIDVRMQP